MMITFADLIAVFFHFLALWQRVRRRNMPKRPTTLLQDPDAESGPNQKQV